VVANHGFQMLEHLALVSAFLLALGPQIQVDVVEELLAKLLTDLLLVLLHAFLFLALLAVVLLLGLRQFVLEHLLRLQLLVAQDLLVSHHDLAEQQVVVGGLRRLLQVVDQTNIRQVVVHVVVPALNWPVVHGVEEAVVDWLAARRPRVRVALLVHLLLRLVEVLSDGLGRLALRAPVISRVNRLLVHGVFLELALCSIAHLLEFSVGLLTLFTSHSFLRGLICWILFFLLLNLWDLLVENFA